MNPECRNIAPLLTPWADRDPMGGDQQALVDRHLADCESCRHVALRERAVHELLRSRSDRLHDIAPAHLREAVRGGSRVVRMPARTARRPPAPWRVPIAAGLVLALLGLGAFAPAGSVLAAQLALDHVKCQLLSPSYSGVGPATLEATWERQYGWPIRVPAGDREGHLELEGMRRCLFHGGSMAHVFYRFDGKRVSLFIMREPRQASAAGAIMGIDTVTWSADGRTYALVGHVSPEQLTALASTLRER